MNDFLQQGVSAFKSGDRGTAKKNFIAAVKQNPESERAWGWMYNVCTTDEERIYCLKQMLRINPKNEKANKLLAELTSFEPPLEQPRPISLANTKSTTQYISPVSKTIPILIASFLTLALIVLFFGPIWPSPGIVRQVIVVYYVGQYSHLTSDEQLEFFNAPDSPVMNALGLYDMSVIFRDLAIGISVLLLLFDLVCVLVNRRIVPNWVWYFLSIVFVVFSLEYLFLSWNLFVAPGPILSLISALLFLCFGLSRMKPKFQ